MKNYIVIFTTAANTAARDFVIVSAADYTKAYIKFILEYPRGYMITEIREA